jgi:hypothetical protein
MSQLCLVCLENSDINIKSISNLIKKCECNFWIHKECINAWIIKEPVCPICKTLLFYETIVDEKTPLATDTTLFIISTKDKKILLNSLATMITILIIVIILIIVLV